MNKPSNHSLNLVLGLMIGSLLAACSVNHENTSSDSVNQQPVTAINPQTLPQQAATISLTEAVTPSTELATREARIRQQHMAKSKQEEKKVARFKRQQQALYSPAPIKSMHDVLSQPFSNVQDGEKYAHYDNNRVIQTRQEAISTFSIDVDTGSYSNVRRLINSGHLPVADAIRTEELINYFNYQNSLPTGEHPFSVNTEVGPSPWSAGRHLLKIGIQAVDIEQQQLPPANLVFLLDVSGSMQSANKLGLLKKSLSLLVSKLRAEDSIAIVVYAGASGVVLEPTSGKHKQKITRALDQLRAGGSTNGGAGIRLAYQVAQQAFIKNGINRILLATDGDFNVGTVNFEQLLNLVEERRKTGISLSTIGFGTGNYNDHLMEQLADAANGKYSYIDNLNEAQKVLVDEMSSSLKTVAKDGKIQIEFNPATVAEYRLIGYENRKLNKEDFNNDKVDAGDIGAGDSVTALYEISLVESQSQLIDPLRYQQRSTEEKAGRLENELAMVKIRYKKPSETSSQLIKNIISRDKLQTSLNKTSDDFRFAASVAGFAELLKGAQFQQDFDFDKLIKLSNSAKGHDQFGYRHEFIQLVRLAASLTSSHQQTMQTQSRR